MSDANGAAATATFTQKDIEAERAHAQHFKAELDELRGKFKAFEGIDPNDYKKTKSELEEIRKQKALLSKEELDAWKAETETSIRSTVQKDYDAVKTEAEKLRQVNKELTVTDRVFAALAPSLMDDVPEIVKGIIRQHGDLNEKGEIVFKDANGQPMYAPGSTTQLAGVEHFKQHLLSKHPSFFKPQGQGGAKTPGDKMNISGTPKPTTHAELAAMPRAQRQQVLATMKGPEIDALK